MLAPGRSARLPVPAGTRSAAVPLPDPRVLPYPAIRRTGMAPACPQPALPAAGRIALAERAETQRVAHRGAAGVVVEVDVGVAACGDHGADPHRPGPQRLAPVHRARTGRALMAAQVDEPGRLPQRRGRPAEPVSPAQRGAASKALRS